MDDKLLIEAIRTGDNSVLEKIYKNYQQEFIAWCIKNYNVDSEQAKEAYQESFIIFYRNICSNRLIDLKSSIKTYLFGIGKNKMRESLRKKTVSMNSNFSINLIDDTDTSYSAEEDAKIEAVVRCMEKLLDSCKKLLKSFYFLKMSMEEMATTMGYKNAATVKNLKYKCINRLREMVNEEMNDLKNTL